jgi:hypothetical protein
LDPLWNHAGPLLWIGNTIYGLVFIWLYLYSFSHREPLRSYAVVAMFVMAAALVPFHNGAVSCLWFLLSQPALLLPVSGEHFFSSGSIWSCWDSTPTDLQLPLGFGARC